MASLKGAGTNDKKKVAGAGGLGVVVLVLAFNAIFGGPAAAPPPPSVPSHPAAAAGAPTSSRASAASTAPAAGATLDPTLHPELMAETENYLYSGSGRNIFSQSSAPPASAAIEKVKASVRPSEQQQIAANTGPPPPPSIDLRFFGYASRKNGTRRAFLTHGDDVFVASEGDVVSHRYKVISIAPSSVQIEDLPYHNTQTLRLVEN